MNRSPRRRIILVAAVLFGIAPLGFGLLRLMMTGSDSRMFWMAAAASMFPAGVLATAIGRRRSRREVAVQSSVILVLSTILAGGTGYLLGATSGPGVWMVAGVFGLSLAASSVLVAVARPDAP